MDQQVNEKLQELLRKVESLTLQQEILQKNIQTIAGEIRGLQTVVAAGQEAELSRLPANTIPETEPRAIAPALQAATESPVSPELKRPAAQPKSFSYQPPPKPSFAEKWLPKDGGSTIDFEKFIGENIISKIGIIILVVGVAIGTKYAIDKDLLSPLTRILLGYLLGIGILAFAISFRHKYENFSAILVSGAMAIFYLITFAAYDFYGLISQAVAFVLMVVFTSFTVSSALFYNRQWIALLGLAGAYGVPFLVSSGSGRVEMLFGYMSLLNLGILAVAYRKYWRILYYVAFGLSWIIFLTWFSTDFQADKHFGLSLAFSTIFFFTFYAIFILHKLVEQRKFEPADILLLLINSFIYFGIGYAAFNEFAPAERFSGLFTLGNAMVHFGVAYAIFQMKLADRNLFYLVSGLVLVFITIAIPVQLDGHWVTLIWAAEAALLYWIGRSKQVGFYEVFSYPLMALALLSQVQDWKGLSTPSSFIVAYENIVPLFNTGFLISLMICAAFGFMMFTGKKHATVLLNPRLNTPQPYAHFFGNIFPMAAFILLLFFTFRQELIHLWLERYSRHYSIIANDNLPFYPSEAPAILLLRVWLLNYSALFMGLWGAALTRFKPGKLACNIYLVIAAFTLLLMASMNNFLLGSLRDSIIQPRDQVFGVSKTTALSIRYISFACTAFLLFVLVHFKKHVSEPAKIIVIGFDILLHLNLLCAGSSELITWLKLNQIAGFDKLGLSILWGVYALLLIGLGIIKKKQHLRIGAIGLFAVTLLKLFFYDLASLDSMAKTIVFISLGILLLIISFLYNRYKNAIGGPDEK